MKKIGSTDEGNVIVEMTPGEWAEANSATTNLLVEDTDDIVTEWGNALWKNLLLLDIPGRCRVTLARGAGLWESRKEIFSYESRRNKKVFDKSVSFDKWCSMVLSRQIDVLDIPNFGPGMRAKLEAAIRRYLNES